MVDARAREMVARDRAALIELTTLIGDRAGAIMAQRRGEPGGAELSATIDDLRRRLDAARVDDDLEAAAAEVRIAINTLTKVINQRFFDRHLKWTRYPTATSEEYLGTRLGQQLIAMDKAYGRVIRPMPEPRVVAFPRASVTEIVPDQKLGPVKFDMVDGVLRVVHQTSEAEPNVRRSAEAARDELIRSSAALVTELARSNQDRALVALVRDMRERLETRQDVIQLGIAALSFQIVCERYHEELSPALSGRLQALAVGIGMLVAQFAEWQEFAENAAQVEYSAADVAWLYHSGGRLVAELEKSDASVDPQVPATIAFVLDAIREPRRAVKRTVFAAIRTMENLIAAVIRSLGVVLSGVPEGARKGVVAGSGAALLYLAAETAIAISPAAGHILKTTWLSQAGKMILEVMGAG